MNAADFPRMPVAEALGRLAEMPEYLEQAVAGRTPAILRMRTAAGGEFSLVEQACHLRDLEREGYLLRLRRMLAEDKPALADFPGGVIARKRDYPSQDAGAAARDFARARGELIAALATLSQEQFCRAALFDGKAITLADLVSMVVEHDRGHREEIAALVATLPAS